MVMYAKKHHDVIKPKKLQLVPQAMSNYNMNCPCCGKQLQEANAATLRLHFRSSVTCVFADLPAAERAAFIKKYSIAPCACDTLVKITKQGKADGLESLLWPRMVNNVLIQR
jgi:hypothetical protein